VVVEYAVDEHGGGLRGVEFFATGVGVKTVKRQCDVHGGYCFF
jgi:hypothetical protein